MAEIRVLIVDDSSFMRSMLKRLIEKDPRFEVVDTANDGAEGVQKAAALKPDVVTMDVEMPVMDGVAALSKIMATDPRPVVMVSSLTEEGAAVTLDAMAKGAVDFIPKALQDNDRNILQAAGNLHDKLAAAAKSNAANASVAATAAPVAPKPVIPQAQSASSAAPGIPAPAAAAPVAAPTSGQKKVAAPKFLLIGASTGGPRAIQAIVEAMQPFNVPALLVQHMPPAFTGPMAQRLNAAAKFEVIEIQDGQTFRPGVLHIAPGGKHLRVKSLGGGLVAEVKDDTGESVYKPSVDVAAESLQAATGKDVVALMLTGMGNDGAREFKSLHAAGAHIITQDEATSVVYGMPKAVVAAAASDEELPLNQIAGRLGQLV